MHIKVFDPNAVIRRELRRYKNQCSYIEMMAEKYIIKHKTNLDTKTISECDSVR